MTWPSSERILVCVGPAPSSARLVRAAARMAAGLRCPWVAAYVAAPALGGTDDATEQRLEEHLRVAESLGATVTRLTGQRVPDTLLAYARKHNVTRIVLGKPTHSRWRDRIKGSLLNDVVRGSADLDVHVITGDHPSGHTRGNQRIAPRRAPLRNYAWAAAIVAVTLGIALTVRAAVALPDLEMLFLLAVMISAAWLGRGPSLLSAAFGVACYDFFFVPPFHTFSVADRAYILTFVMMFGVGLVISELVGRLRRQEQDARTREDRTAVLYALVRELSPVDRASQIATISARHAFDAFAARAWILMPTDEGNLDAAASFPNDLPVDSKALELAQWAFQHDELAGLGTGTLPGSPVVCAPLRVGGSRLGVLALLPVEKAALSADQRAFLDVFCRQVAAALERAQLSEAARLAALRAKTEEMRSSLLSAVSHDLRTPLGSITGAATVLRDDPELGSETRADLVESIVEEAERLERLVGNLLDMTRLESGSVSLKRDWVPLDEIVGSALTRLEERLEDRKVSVQLDDDIPLLFVDPVLLQQIFVNLLENVDKYTPPHTPVEIRAQRDADYVVVEVIDRGPGVPPGAEEKVFEKFFRAARAGVGGAGLGLAICKAIVEAHGGTISAQNTAVGGCAIRIRIPVGGTPPSLLPPSGSEV